MKSELGFLIPEIDALQCPFNLYRINLDEVQVFFANFREKNKYDLVILIAKTIYFQDLDKFTRVFEQNQYTHYPLFLVISQDFTADEIDSILASHNLFHVPAGSSAHLVGAVKTALLFFHSRKREVNNIIDAFKSQVHLELFKRSEKRNSLLLEKVQAQSYIINSMYDFSNSLNSQGNIDAILESIIRTIRQFTGCQRISIMLIDETSQDLIIRKAIGLPADIVKQTRLKINEGLAGNVFREGRILILNGQNKDELDREYLDYNKITGYPIIIIPLIEHEHKLGIVNVTNKPDNAPFTNDDIEILSSISQSSSIAINNQLNKIRVEDAFLGMTKAMVRVIETKDTYTRGHSDRVVELSVAIAKRMGLPSDMIKSLRIAGILHDIGKIGIPGAILRNPSKLTGKEYEKMRAHPLIGETILKDIKAFTHIRSIIRHHHERIDGTGYPDRLKGEEIPLESRIIAAVDAFDAMIYSRPYRKRVSLPAIISELKKASGTQLDSKCVLVLLAYLDEHKNVYQK